MNEHEVKEYLEKGHIYASVVFEIIGSPVEHVKNALETVLKSVKEDSEIIFVQEELGEPEKTGDLWGAFCDVDILVNSIDKLSWLAFNFAPASIEILEPGKITLKDKEVTDFLSDALSQVHAMNATNLSIQSNNKLLQRNINAVVRNSILIALNNKSLDAEEISKLVGIKSTDLKPVFDAMIKENKIIREKDKYKTK